MPFTIQTTMLIGLFAPLGVAALLPLIANLKHGAIIRDAIAPIAALVSFGMAVIIAIAVLEGEVPQVTLLQITEGISLTFRATPPGAIFACVVSGLWVLAALYSPAYMRGNHEHKQTRFAICYAIAIHATMAIAWASNLMVLFIFYEILTFSTYLLVTHKEDKESMQAGRLYMGMLVGSSFILLLPAIIWVWVATGTLDFTKGGILAGQINPAFVPWMLALFAFGVGKVALMPLHRWLPAAMVAPTPVSALLHAVAVVKAGAFSMLMILVYIFGIDFLAETKGSVWLVWLASFTILAASVIAIQKDDLKARLAYSTVSQLSYIVLAAALATPLAAEVGLVHITMHATAKITLFFCAGAIYTATHLKNISDLDGLARRMPFVFIAFFLGSLSIIGIPPLGGSWSKFMLMAGAVDAGFTIILGVLIISSLLNIYYLMEPVMRGFFRPLRHDLDARAPFFTVFPPVITALVSLGLFFAIGYLNQFSAMMVR